MQQTPKLQTLSAKAYMQLLRLYPSSYQQKYALDMQRTFDDCCRFAFQEYGARGLLRLWMPTLADLSLTIIEKHLDEGVLSSGATMIRGTSFALMAVAALLYTTAWDAGMAPVLIATLLLAFGALGLFLTSPLALDLLRRRFDRSYTALDSLSAPNGPDESRRVEMFKFEGKFLLQWVAASGLGLIVEFMIYFSLVVSFAEDLDLPVQTLIAAGAGLLLGAAVGIAQWLVLRRRITQPRRWILSSVAGGAVGGTLALLIGQPTGDAFNFNMAMLIGSGMVGIALGAAEWLLLRRYVSRAGWWVIASATGIVTALALSNMLGQLLYYLFLGALGESTARTLAMLIFGALFLTAYGAITGYVLIWLFKQPRPALAELSQST